LRVGYSIGSHDLPHICERLTDETE
jgi:hypothetical protein